jgi:hypothetical protein
MDEDVKTKLTAAWQTAVARLIETGYAPKDVYDTMISVGLSGVEDRANDNPRPSGEVRLRTERPSRPLRMVVLGVIGAVVLAILVSLVLGTQQRTAYESFATEGVRVGDPGHNLVGPDWSGDAGAKGKR